MLSRVCARLREKGIPYRVKSREEKSTSAPMVRVSGGQVIGTRSGGVPLSWVEEPNRGSAFYIIYVKSRDFSGM